MLKATTSVPQTSAAPKVILSSTRRRGGGRKRPTPRRATPPITPDTRTVAASGSLRVRPSAKARTMAKPHRSGGAVRGATLVDRLDVQAVDRDPVDGDGRLERVGVAQSAPASGEDQPADGTGDEQDHHDDRDDRRPEPLAIRRVVGEGVLEVRPRPPAAPSGGSASLPTLGRCWRFSRSSCPWTSSPTAHVDDTTGPVGWRAQHLERQERDRKSHVTGAAPVC